MQHKGPAVRMAWSVARTGGVSVTLAVRCVTGKTSKKDQRSVKRSLNVKCNQDYFLYLIYFFEELLAPRFA